MKNSSKNIKIVILIFGIFISTVAYLAWTSFSLQNFTQDISEVLVGIPEVNVPVLSKENNTYHNINIEFFLQVDSNDKPNLDMYQIESDIIFIVENMNYDDIVSIGNMDYIRNNVMENLSLNNDNIEILNVYISNIST